MVFNFTALALGQSRTKVGAKKPTPYRLQVISETGEEIGPILKVSGELKDGTIKGLNEGRKMAKFYDDETGTSYIRWVAEDELVIALSNPKYHKRLIYIVGEVKEPWSWDSPGPRLNKRALNEEGKNVWIGTGKHYLRLTF